MEFSNVFLMGFDLIAFGLALVFQFVNLFNVLLDDCIPLFHFF